MFRQFLLTLFSARALAFGSLPESKNAWHTVEYPDDNLDGLTFETFLSPAESLKLGQVANNIKPAKWIKGPKAIRYMATEIVDAAGEIMPEEELYVHHWFFMNSGVPSGVEFNQMIPGAFNMGYCFAELPGYGTGAELNGQVLRFPAPLAIMTTGDENWSLNLHFIRTGGMSPEKTVPCIECKCPDSTPENPHGSHFCPNCLDQAQCWGMEGVESEPKDYFLKYTIGYTDIDDATRPVSVLNFDGATHQGGKCMVEYDVKLPDGKPMSNTSEFVMSQNFNATLIASHLHVGGTQLTVEHWRDGALKGIICDTVAGYNDIGHLTEMPFCLYDYDNAYQLKKGDVVKVTGHHSTRTLTGAPVVDYHMGVMALMWMFGEAESQEGLFKDFSDVMSRPAEGAGAALTEENWSPLPGVKMAPVGVSESQYFVTLTCFPDAWCGFGFNNKRFMSNAIAYIVSEDKSSGELALQRRKLGDHNPGELLIANVENEVASNLDGSVSYTFALDIPEDYRCVLAAMGTSTTFSYHGQQRASVCP